MTGYLGAVADPTQSAIFGRALGGTYLDATMSIFRMGITALP